MPGWTSSASTEPARRASAPARPSRIGAALLHPATKPALVVLGLLPLAWLVVRAATDALGPNPAEALIRSTGDWTLRLLLATLTVTPLRQWTGWHALARLRRSLGLLTFLYSSLHALAFAWLDMGLDLDAIVRDIVKRPFILVGTAALLLMVPLAATSFNRAIRTLGAARWQALHRSVYAIGLLGVLHFFWMRSGKHLYGEVGIYAAVLAVLLGWRLWRRWAWRPRRAAT